ncbi:MAG: DNA-directed RNA polymerase subunit omega [Candidatus Acidiferrales bacterium]
MPIQNEAPECRFSFVVIAARRARQLMAGAPPMVAPRSHKPTRVAVEELENGVLEFNLPEEPVDITKTGKLKKD